MLEDFNGFYICVILAPVLVATAMYFMRDWVKEKTKAWYLICWNVLFTLFLVLVLFASMETWYRFFVDTTDSYGLNMITQRWFKNHCQYNNVKYRDNINYIVAGRDASKKHRFTFFGDSFTEGHGIKDVDNRFVNLIRKNNKDWEVQSFAERGFETTNEINSLENSIRLKYEFDYIVLCYCLNDISDQMPESKVVYDRIYHVYKKQMGFLDSNSYFMNTYYYRLKGSKDPAISNYYNFVKKAYSGPVWDLQKKNLKKFVDLAREHGAKVLTVTFPFLNSVGSDYEYAFVHKRLDSLWKALDVPHLDLLPVYMNHKTSELVVNKYDAHPNEKAHKMAAEAISQFMRASVRE